MDAETESELGTGRLLQQAVGELRALARAELLHAEQELEDDLSSSLRAVSLLGGGAAVGLCGVACLAVAVGLWLPGGAVLGVAVVGALSLGVGGLLALRGYRRLPKQPLRHTRARLKSDMTLTQETWS